MFYCLHQKRVLNVSSVVGAPWRCGVLTTQGGIAGIEGRLLGGEHASTPTEWGGGSSSVKTEPPQIVLLLLLLLLLLFLTIVNEASCLCQHAATVSLCRSPRRRRTLHRRWLRKLALNSGTTRRSAKNAEKNLEKPLIAAINAGCVPALLYNWNVHELWR